MLYLNYNEEIKKYSTCENLTLTSVVFELPFTSTTSSMPLDLTLTSVVFEYNPFL